VALSQGGKLRHPTSEMGQKATSRLAPTDVGFTPNIGHPETVVECRFVPIPDSCSAV